jgi:deoxycytidylate deaminase
MNQYIQVALNQSEKSLARDHKHGAVCVMGGRIVSVGHNCPSEPHFIKIDKKGV